MASKDPTIRRATWNRYRKRLRDMVLFAYGRACNCCGETEEAFLCLDHVNNDGHKHRKEKGIGGSGLYLWAIKNNYPNTIQILCYNCNMAKAFQGTCPHQNSML